MVHPASQTLLRFIAACFLLSLAGCVSAPELDLVLAESPRGAVYLERIPNRSFQAAHPIKIDQGILARILRGISVKEQQGVLQNFLAGQPPVVSVFTEDEIRYLTPLLAEGLTRAAPDQQVGFRLVQSNSSSADSSNPSSARLALMETSKGSLYAYGRSLHVTLLEYHVHSERMAPIDMTSRRQTDYTGLKNHILSFTPESAKRPDSFRGPNDTDTTLVVDYDALAALPTNAPIPLLPPVPAKGMAQPPTPSPTPGIGTDAQLRQLQEQMGQKNRELEDLRKELQDIRRQMREPAATAPTPPR